MPLSFMRIKLKLKQGLRNKFEETQRANSYFQTFDGDQLGVIM
jgi:hypothetical protein